MRKILMPGKKADEKETDEDMGLTKLSRISIEVIWNVLLVLQHRGVTAW